MTGHPTLLLCVGATKAGTSWLYRYLHAHPECRMRSIKELHFFDTVDFNDYEHQFDTYARLRSDLAARLAGASQWRAGNLQRQIDDVDEIVAALALAQAGDEEGAVKAYCDYLFAAAGGRSLVGDITPGYALLSQSRLAMMAGLSPAVRVLYLMRDPLDRLWSHVRMQATRQLRAGEEVGIKSRRVMNRVIRRGMEIHIPARGDYQGTIERLRAAVPASQLMIEFSERLLTETGLRRLCAFLGIGYRAADTTERAHEGVKLRLDPGQRLLAQAFLAPQYDFVEQNFGPLPVEWQANRAEVRV